MAGPFFFAWVDSSETTFGPSHQRFDEEVFSFSIDHHEGEFAAATIDIRNPRVGLLAAGRKQWAWLAWDSAGSDGVVPLFFGRLVALPQDLQGELVRLDLVARPGDFVARQQALAPSLKVAPWWDPVFIQPDRLDDPAALLEARTALWHVDRVTHEVTVSDILQGEEGTLAIGGEFFYDSLGVTYGQVPGRRITVNASVAWDQVAAGSVNLTKALLKAAKDADSGDGNNIDTYTGEGLANSWPVKGTAIGAGWSVGRSFVKRGNRKWKKGQETKQTVFANGLIMDFPTWTFKPHFEADYDADRSRVETLSFTLVADVQAMATDPGDDEVILLTTSSGQVDQPIDRHGTADDMPIGDPRRNSYFQTDRGHQSIQYLLALARAQLLMRARCVDVGFEVDWRAGFGMGLSCRKSASIADDRLPGGAALGKIVGYTLAFDGDSGTGTCRIALACAVGKGASVAPDAGTPAWADAGYVDVGYQAYAGATLSAAAGDVTYDSPDGTQILDDGLDFLDMTVQQALVNVVVTDGKKVQAALLDAFLPDAQAAIDALNQAFTQITVNLRPLNAGPFQTDYALAVSDLMVPKMIDLEAA